MCTKHKYDFATRHNTFVHYIYLALYCRYGLTAHRHLRDYSI